MNIKVSPHDDLEKVLIKWFESMCSANLPTDGSIIWENAARVSLNVVLNNLKASTGWLD
jgi:hypothetical protein